MKVNWSGVIPAITTPFREDGSVDLAFLVEHARWMIDAGCVGIVPLGSLGEGGCLSFEEKRAVLEALVKGLPGTPIIPGVAALSTDEAVRIARLAREVGCAGLMVLPPYVYSSDWREMKAHVAAVIAATDLPCMLYNNPVAYRTDFSAAQMAELAAEHANLVAVKESSTDVRRITAIKAELGDRLRILVGVDDLIVEGIAAGAEGWIAGLVNAMPVESVKIFEHARRGEADKIMALYHWFLPLLRMDTVPKFVQLIKLVQARVGKGSERVRAPRLVLSGAERDVAEAQIAHALKHRPGG